MHANGWLRGYAHPAVHKVNHDHTFAFVRIAFPASRLTGTAAYATGGINEQGLDRQCSSPFGSEGLRFLFWLFLRFPHFVWEHLWGVLGGKVDGDVTRA